MVLPEKFRRTMHSIFLNQELPKITNLDLRRKDTKTNSEPEINVEKQSNQEMR